MNNQVVRMLRRTADDLEKGRWRDWSAQMAMEQPEIELNPIAAECPLDALRHFRAGDEITVVVTLTAP